MDMPTPDKFGSPYDPRNHGKIQMPLSAAEQHRLRGCGDPECAMCNRETNGLGLPRPLGAGWGIVSSMETAGTMFEAYKETLSRRFFEAAISSTSRSFDGVVTVEGENTRDFQTKALSVPENYTKARAEVEKWLCPVPEQAFSEIVGNDEALMQLRDAITAPVAHKDLYAAYGMTMPRGALLSGPPGCGKTMFARAAAAEMRRLYGEATEFLSISGSELQSPYVGVTEGHIKSLFNFAREYHAYRGHPLLIFIDEAEVLFPDRTGRIRRVASWEESQVATFLAEIDGMRECGAFVLLASNRPEVIDSALLRDGRCDFKITVKRPAPEAVEIILRNNFAATLTGPDPIDALVMAALESLFDPHRILVDASAIGVGKENLGQLHHKHFLLEHIVSGAMAASIPRRATRYAFARDKAEGVAKGVVVADVIASVNDLFAENLKLDHSFALADFTKEFLGELTTESARPA